MDRFIAGFRAFEDDDLMLCPENGAAYQRDMAIRRVLYDEAYFNKCAGYEDQEIALKINAGRIALVNKYVGSSCDVLDIGIGSGEFIKKRPYTFGYDINPKAVEWLNGWKRWSDDFAAFHAMTFWDVIEHVPEPDVYLRHVPHDGFAFFSLPIFPDLNCIRKSRHYRPGEHLYYWTENGFSEWMKLHRFVLRDVQRFETDAGRDSIVSFAFERSKR